MKYLAIHSLTDNVKELGDLNKWNVFYKDLYKAKYSPLFYSLKQMQNKDFWLIILLQVMAKKWKKKRKWNQRKMETKRKNCWWIVKIFDTLNAAMKLTFFFFFFFNPDVMSLRILTSRIIKFLVIKKIGKWSQFSLSGLNEIIRGPNKNAINFTLCWNLWL